MKIQEAIEKLVDIHCIDQQQHDAVMGIVTEHGMKLNIKFSGLNISILDSEGYDIVPHTTSLMYSYERTIIPASDFIKQNT